MRHLSSVLPCVCKDQCNPIIDRFNSSASFVLSSCNITYYIYLKLALRLQCTEKAQFEPLRMGRAEAAGMRAWAFWLGLLFNICICAYAILECAPVEALVAAQDLSSGIAISNLHDQLLAANFKTKILVMRMFTAAQCLSSSPYACTHPSFGILLCLCRSFTMDSALVRPQMACNKHCISLASLRWCCT